MHFSSTGMPESRPIEIEKANEENLDVINNKSCQYNCEKCGEKFHLKTNFEKHKNKCELKFMFCTICKKVDVNVSNHICERIPLKSNATKRNQMNVKENMSTQKEDSIDTGSVEKDLKMDVDVNEGSENEEDVNESEINYDNDDGASEADEDRESPDENNQNVKKSSKKKLPKNKNSNQKIFKCQECLQLFSKYLSLSHHLKSVHKKQGKFKCEICDEDFSTSEDFEFHKSLHGPEDKVVCRGCRKTFNTLKLYYIHAKQNPGMHCFVCKLCFRKFPTELMLDQHVCICQNGKPLHCACGREFTRYQDVINHSKGTKPFSCCSCPHLANSLTAYIRHLRKHSKQKPFQCTKCDMKFAVIDFLNIHNKKYHSEMDGETQKEQSCEQKEVDQHICGLCQESFLSSDELNKHNSEVHEQKNTAEEERVQCQDCGKLLKRNRLENHRNTHKTSASLCPECGKLFDTRFKLTQHIITAHNNEPVKCEVCMKVLKTKKILNEHMKTHLKSELGGRIPQAICPMCGLGLAQKGSLARHILLTHEKHKIVPCNKTFTCQECSEVLPNRAKYYSHRRMHRAMVDRFPCEICGREFNKKQNLKRHLYLLHDETRVLADPIFKCQFCTRCFREKKNLKRHYKMVHKVEDIL